MMNQRKWLVALAAIIGAVVAVAAGVPAGTLLIVGALLLCPAAMYFGMQGMQQGGCGHGGGGSNCDHGKDSGAKGIETRNQAPPKAAA